MRYFIKEENTHSAYLAQYMKWHRVPERKRSVLDSIFRRLRQVNGIRSEVTVLVTAEIIALSYYTALKNATKSSALKSICSQMLHDELPHVVFQSYTLAHFHNTAWTGFQTQDADDSCLPGGLDRLPERIPVRRVFSAQISAEQPVSAASV